MKSFITLLLIFGFGACSPNDRYKELVGEAEEFCACHSGVEAFSYNEYSYDLNCRDGVGSKGQGDMTKQHFYSTRPIKPSCPR